MANHIVANDVRPDTADRIAGDLIELLHRGAPAEDFARRLARAEALPEGYAGKSMLLERARMAAAVRDRLELQQQRERGMLAIIESAQDLSSRLDLTSLLNAIVSRARNLLGADLAWLSVYDAERDEFRALVADGALSPNTAGMVARRDRGMVSVVMSTRLPFTTADYLHDKRFPHDAKLDDTFLEEGIGALVGVPLIWECEVIGLLFVADRYHRLYLAQSISILCTLGTLAAVALKNAREFERANAAVAKAALDRAELERHARSIERAAEAHEQMTSLLQEALPFRPCARRSCSCSAAACWCSMKRARSSAVAPRLNSPEPPPGPTHRTGSTRWSFRARCSSAGKPDAR